jgi:hypothetical protein
MIVYYNKKQDNLIDFLRNEHQKVRSNLSVVSPIDSQIKQITKNLKKNNPTEAAQIARDGFLGSLRRIEWSYCELVKIDNDFGSHDKREILILSFFHNAKSFIEIFKKNFGKIKLDKEEERLFRDIRTIRNFIVHSYEKDFIHQKTFVRIDPNHHHNDGLFQLEIFDLETAEKIYQIHFSVHIFLDKIKNILDKIEQETA